MRAPRLRALGLGFALFAGLAALLVWNSRRTPARRPLAGLAPADISRIELAYRGRELAVERSGSGWSLVRPSSGPADALACDDLASGLVELTLGSKVAAAPSSYDDYELNESSAARVRAYARGEPAPRLDAYLGKEAIGYDTLYFRRFREAPVYVASGLDGYLLRRDPSDYKRK